MTYVSRSYGGTLPQREPKKGRPVMVGAVVAIVAAAAIAAGFIFGQGETAPTAAVVQHSQATVEQLVNQGLIPEQVLQSTGQAQLETMQDLVNRGLIPEQALQSTEQARLETMQDLVNRGLIPEKALQSSNAAASEANRELPTGNLERFLPGEEASQPATQFPPPGFVR